MRKAPQLNGMLMFSDLQYMIAFSCWALVLFIGYTANIYLLPRQRYVLYTVRVLLPKCPLTTVRSRFSADKLQIIRGEAICCSSALKLLLTEEKTSTGI